MPKSWLPKSLIVVALAGPMGLGGLWAAQAQEAAPAAEAAPAPIPSCSGLGCLFSGGAQPAQAQVPQPAPTAAAEPPLPADAVAEAPKPKPKPQHPVTIAADPAEVARLKGLVATMAKGKVKIVKAASPKADAEADFSVATVLDQHDSAERAKLFTEQLHILAGSDIHSVGDLAGKVVSFGPDNSENQIAARKAFGALNISVKETPLDLDNALDGLSTGDVAAVVVLAPQPVERFETLTAPGLHLVSWPEDGALPTGAVAATIDPARYPGLAKSDEVIHAVGVDAVLKISARGARQPACKSFLTALAQHSAMLSRRGFDLLKADLESRSGRRFASEESR